MLQFTGTHQKCNPGQRLHEELGDGSDPRDSGLHVPCGVRGWQPHHRGGRGGEHRVRHGRFVRLLVCSVVTLSVNIALQSGSPISAVARLWLTLLNTIFVI